MFQVISALSQVQRAEEVRSRKDAAQREGHSPFDDSGKPAAPPARGRAEVPGQVGPLPAKEKNYRAPPGDDAEVLAVLDRAVRTFNQTEAEPGRLRLPLREGTNVPFEALQRAATGEQLFLDVPGAEDQKAASVPFEQLQRAASAAGERDGVPEARPPRASELPRSREPSPEEQLELPWGPNEDSLATGAAGSRATPEGGSTAETAESSVFAEPRIDGEAALPSDQWRRPNVDAASAKASESEGVERELAAFEAPAAGGPPFGREIPFDMTVSGTQEATDAARPRGADLVRRMRSEFAAHRYMEEDGRSLGSPVDQVRSFESTLPEMAI